MEDEQPSEVIDRYKQELREAADEIGRLHNTLRKALAATDFVWSKQLIRQALSEQENRRRGAFSGRESPTYQPRAKWIPSAEKRPWRRFRLE